MNTEELKRYNRHLILPEIGMKGQQKLKQAKVLVIGAGGLGCPALQYLVAAGVGYIGIVDDDKVDESNLQRQILFSTEDIGEYKVKVAKEKLSKQNPFIYIATHQCYINNQNALAIIDKYDIVVDGSDNFPTRYLLNDACVLLNKVLVFGSIFKFQGQVSVFNYKDGPTYRCLYPTPPRENEVPNCSEIGVIGILPGIVGTLQANEVIKIITEIGEVLSGKLLTFDALSAAFETFTFSINPTNKTITELSDYQLLCNTATGVVENEISAQELKQKIASKEKFQLIDVREFYENDLNNIGGELIPMNEIEENLDKLKRDVPIVFYCQNGSRSKTVVNLLLKKGFQNIFSLTKGLTDF